MYKSGIFVAVQVKTGAITSSPSRISAHKYDKCKASVPDPTAIQFKFDVKLTRAKRFDKVIYKLD